MKKNGAGYARYAVFGVVLFACCLVGVSGVSAQEGTTTPTATPTLTPVLPTLTPFPTVDIPPTGTPELPGITRYTWNVGFKTGVGGSTTWQQVQAGEGEQLVAVCYQGVQGQWTQQFIYVGIDSSHVMSNTAFSFWVEWSMSGGAFENGGFDLQYPLYWLRDYGTLARGAKSGTGSGTASLSVTDVDQWNARIISDGGYGKNTVPEWRWYFANAGTACLEIVAGTIENAGGGIEPTPTPQPWSTVAWPTPNGTPPAAIWVVPGDTVCFRLLPVIDNILGYPVGFGGFELCLEEYSVGAVLLGWDLGKILASMAVLASALIVWRVIQS